jgi:hypothetical protein
MRSTTLSASLAAGLALAPMDAEAFCGFYVAKADSDLFNEASKVVIARDGERTVITMANDYKGELEEFAIVIPVPTALERGQIHVADNALIEHIDAYTAPRLVEYYDDDPCRRDFYALEDAAPMAMRSKSAGASAARAKALGVTIEATYTVGEYDILILSAEQSGGLETWLREEGYRIPAGAGPVLGSYIKQDMRFFVAKVNLSEQSKLGYTYLRPLQVAFETPKFMLPIRLGTLNARGPQELFVYTLTRKGRVETTNYRNARIPSDVEIPMFVREEFGDFYRDMFAEQVRRDGMKAVYTEYAWDMGWCDPCAADPLSPEELRTLGVFWLDRPEPRPMPGKPGQPGVLPRRMPPPMPGGAADVFVTRLHLRYDGEHFPEDLFFQQTGDRENFQGRYVLRHAWKGDADQCPEAKEYFRDLDRRREERAKNLANLTGRPIAKIRDRMQLDEEPADGPKWWEDLWD